MEIERRKLKRKPFSDVTNQLPISNSNFHGSKPCTPPKYPPTFSNSVAADSHLSNDSKVSAEKDKDKGKSPLLQPFSCPPIPRTKRIWDENEQEENGDINSRSDIILSKKRADSHPRTKKRRNSMPALPRDFVEEQRKYFAEVDAFQLEEEIVSESDLE